MKTERQIIAEQILREIDYGNLPRKEAERRVLNIIEAELSVPLGTKVNMEKVRLCNSLLREFATHGEMDWPDRSEERKEAVIKKHLAYKRRRRILTNAARAIAAALVLVVGLSALKVLPPIRWFTSASTDDEQQYVVTGHEINTEAVAKAIANREVFSHLRTSSLQELEDFLQLSLPFPQRVGDSFIATDYSSMIYPNNISVSCRYVNDQEHWINYILYIFTSFEDAYIELEQESQGKEITVNGQNVYTFTNIPTVCFTWHQQNIVYILEFDRTYEQPQNIVPYFIGGSL